MNKLFTFLIVLLSLTGSAQNQPEMADAMRGDGKIYVVISVIALIFISLVLFLVYLERRLSRLEKKQDELKDGKNLSRH